MKTPLRNQRGQDLVEFALLIPITLMCLLVILDLGRATFAYSVIYGAVREGARYASVNFEDSFSRTSEAAAIIRDRVPGLDPVDLTVTISWNDNTGQLDEPGRVTVEASYPFDPITPFIGQLLGADPFTIGTRATMNLEY